MAKKLMDGQLVNTTFAVFAPDGSTKLTQKARSVRTAFTAISGRSVEAGLRTLAQRYPGQALDEPAHTPDFSSLRESVNVAACDGRPLVVAWGSDAAATETLESSLRALAWSDEFVGRVHWDFVSGADDLRALVPDAPEADHGVVVVQPEPFGRTASVLVPIDPEASLEVQQATLREAMTTFEGSFSKLEYRAHVQQGKRLGVTWEEAIKMGDRDDGPQGERDRDRDRGRREGRERRDDGDERRPRRGRGS